ncbi:hypothetical protein FACS189427_06490 [Planctomycetales bacterium]|nr:hypothetical protein FACS189427_06490 [Planctomycetales bacterium]
MKKQGDNLDNVKRELKSQQCSETKLSDEPQVLLRCTCGSLGFTIVQLLVIIAVAIAVYPYSGAILLAQQPATKYDGIISKDNVSVFVVISTHETIGSGKYSTTVEKIFPEFQFTIINSSGKVLDSVTFQIVIKGDGRERFVDFGEKTCSVEGGLPDGQIERFKRDADWLGSNESNRIKNLGEGLCIAYITKINGKKVN